MTCDEARQAFSDLYEGSLSGPPLAGLDRHLEGCPSCREEWSAFRKTMQVMAALGGAEPAPGFAARVMERIEAPSLWQRIGQALFVPFRVKVPLQALAVALLAVTAVVLYQRSPELRREAQVPIPLSRPAEEAQEKPRTRVELQDAKPADRPAAPAGKVSPPPGISGRAERDRAANLRGRTDAVTRQAEGPPAAQAPAPPTAAPSPTPAESTISGTRTEVKEKDEAAEEVGARREVGKMADAETRPRTTVSEPAEAIRPQVRSAPAPAGEVRHGLLAPGRPAAPAPEAVQPEPQAPAKEGGLAVLPAGSADELYSAALTHYARREYGHAIEAFRTFLAQHPQDGRSPDARFRLADSYFSEARYAEAIPAYEAVIRQVPASRHLRPALFRQGHALLAVGDPSGCQVLRDAVTRYPQAAEAAHAREALSAPPCP